MGFLNKKNIILPLCAAIGVIAGCSRNTSSVTAERSSLSFNITGAVAGIKAPQQLVITIANGSGFNRERTIPSPANTGSFQFPEVPYGHLFIDIQGLNDGLRTMFGHSEMEITVPNANSNVVLRNSLTTKTIGPLPEQLFLRLVAERSAFWNDLPANSTALCATASGSASMRTTVLASQQYLYFLFEVTDGNFVDEDRAVNQSGEMTSDAVIVYLCKSPPYALNTTGNVFPAARFQCEVGRNMLDNCKFNFANFETGTVRTIAMAALNTDEVKGRLLRNVTNLKQRTLELRINKELFELPTDNIDNNLLFGLVIRYRDSIDPAEPIQLCDWQSGQVESDPKTMLASWGYLEITR